MNHKELPIKIKKRILKYYSCLWKKFKGMKDYEVLSFLPETIKDEILLTILNELIYYKINSLKFFIIELLEKSNSFLKTIQKLF